MLMHPAVDLLLKRMESNPDEFVNQHQKNRRWEIIIEKYKGYMDDKDRETIKKKYSELQMDACHKEVMAELLRTEEPVQKEFNFGQTPMQTYGSNNVSVSGSLTTPTTITVHTSKN